jgi:amino acid permease
LEAKEQMSSKQVLKIEGQSFPLVARFLFLNFVMYPHWQSSKTEISQIWLHDDFYSKKISLASGY